MGFTDQYDVRLLLHICMHKRASVNFCHCLARISISE